jgi:hypothetical protein
MRKRGLDAELRYLEAAAEAGALAVVQAAGKRLRARSPGSSSGPETSHRHLIPKRYNVT